MKPYIVAHMMSSLDGRGEHPSSFEMAMEKWQALAYLKLTSVEQKEQGAVWLRYKKA